MNHDNLMLQAQFSCQWVQAFARLNQDLRKDSDPGEILELMTASAVEASGADLGLVFLGSEIPWMCEAAKGLPELVGGYLGSTINLPVEVAATPHLGDASQIVPLNFAGSAPLLGEAMFVPIYDLDNSANTNVAADASETVENITDTTEDRECADEDPKNLSGIIVLARQAGKASFSEANLQGANAFVSVCGNIIGLLQNNAYAPLTATDSDNAVKLARISRDLHDLVIQQLFAAGMEVASLQHKIRADGVSKTALIQFLQSMQNNLDEAIRQIRVLLLTA